jgi:hypothetical protein
MKGTTQRKYQQQQHSHTKSNTQQLRQKNFTFINLTDVVYRHAGKIPEIHKTLKTQSFMSHYYLDQNLVARFYNGRPHQNQRKRREKSLPKDSTCRASTKVQNQYTVNEHCELDRCKYSSSDLRSHEVQQKNHKDGHCQKKKDNFEKSNNLAPHLQQGHFSHTKPARTRIKIKELLN